MEEPVAALTLLMHRDADGVKGKAYGDDTGVITGRGVFSSIEKRLVFPNVHDDRRGELFDSSWPRNPASCSKKTAIWQKE
eukprot:192226-Hanusia_phi.AAC.1